MVVYNAGDTSSENNPHNIPGPPGSISTEQLLSPQAGYQAKPTLRNNTQSRLLTLSYPSKEPKMPQI